MPSRINSTTTSPGGLIQTGDSDNSLLIQTGDTTAITVNSSQVVSLTNPLPVASGGTGSSSGVNLATGVTGTLPIANGGTGQTTAAAAYNALNPMTTTGDIIYEASPTTAARLPIGSTGQVLTVASGIPSWGTISSGPSGITSQVFTSNGTFTIPTGVTALKVTVVGGGGGSGNAVAGACSDGVTGGGSGAGTAISYLTGLTPGNTITVTVGAGGGIASNGGNSTITSGTQSVTTITGGGGLGSPNRTNDRESVGRVGGTATGGQININGQTTARPLDGINGMGTGSLYGFGGIRTTVGAGAGVQGTGFGSGASGAYASPASQSGASGRAGIVIFEW